MSSLALLPDRIGEWKQLPDRIDLALVDAFENWTKYATRRFRGTLQPHKKNNVSNMKASYLLVNLFYMGLIIFQEVAVLNLTPDLYETKSEIQNQFYFA